jgi:hypothetical protein
MVADIDRDRVRQDPIEIAVASTRSSNTLPQAPTLWLLVRIIGPFS